MSRKNSYKGSSKERGSGIGLAVTDEIVQMHGGSLDITSKPGAGTAVYVRVPAIQMDDVDDPESLEENNTL